MAHRQALSARVAGAPLVIAGAPALQGSSADAAPADVPAWYVRLVVTKTTAALAEGPSQVNGVSEAKIGELDRLALNRLSWPRGRSIAGLAQRLNETPGEARVTIHAKAT